jgi:hypothetical protein
MAGYHLMLRQKMKSLTGTMFEMYRTFIVLAVMVNLKNMGKSWLC